MLVIRTEQLHALREARIEALRVAALEEVRAHYPVECALLGPLGTRRAVRAGVERARSHGLETGADILAYLAVAFALGSGFDRDPLLPWAAATLRDAPEVVRGRTIAEDAVVHLARIEGLDGTAPERATARLRGVRVDDLLAVRGELDSHLRRVCREVHPEKLGATRATFPAFVELAVSRAAQAGLRSTGGALVYGLHMFFWGSEFADDPLHPWAARALADAPAEEGERARRLHAAALERLDQAAAVAAGEGV